MDDDVLILDSITVIDGNGKKVYHFPVEPIPKNQITIYLFSDRKRQSKRATT
jgi:hypothetical protein